MLPFNIAIIETKFVIVRYFFADMALSCVSIHCYLPSSSEVLLRNWPLPIIRSCEASFKIAIMC